MSTQVSKQSKFSNRMIWKMQKSKSVYAHLFRYAFTLLHFHTNRQVCK